MPEIEGDEMRLTAPAFAHETPIPAKFSCHGEDVSPELHIAGIPEGAAVLALIMDDPDAPAGTWDHWVAFDIDPVSIIPEDVGELGIGGSNSWRRLGYGGPCPPSGTHRYFFRLFALDAPLRLPEGATKADVLDAMDGRVLAEAVLMGTFSA